MAFTKISFKNKHVFHAVIFLMFYFVFLIVNVPANVVFSIIKLPTNIQVSAVSGTLWSGQAKQVRVKNIDLGELTWELSPLNLLIAELSIDTSLLNQDEFFKSKVALSASGNIQLTDTSFFINLSSLQPLTQIMPFSYSGKLAGTLPSVSFEKNSHIEINGGISLSEVKLISPQRQLFGDFKIDFNAEKNDTLVKVKSITGPLNVDANIKLDKLGKVSISARLKAEQSNKKLAQMISFLGKRNAGNEVSVNSQLSLW